MILVDANVLLYAYGSDSEHHESCRRWLETALNGSEPVGLPWQSIIAFVRIATNPRVFGKPLSAKAAVGIVDDWLACAPAMLIGPADGYWSELKKQLLEAQVSGPLVSDAALAALAIEHGATLCTTDRDFARFHGLKTFNPVRAR